MTHSVLSRRALRALAAGTLVLGLGLGACSAPKENTSTESPAASASASQGAEGTAAAFPRDVDVHGQSVHLDAAPQRIAVASPDAAVLLAALVDGERFVATPDFGPETPAGATRIPGSHTVDPEQLLSMEPDLVVLTSRHGQEKDAASMLQSSGVPTVVMPSDAWSSIDDLKENLSILGSVVGAEEKASELNDSIQSKREEITASLKKDTHPRVLTLMAHGGKKMLMPKSTMLNGLVREAGGVPAIDEQGGHGVLPADPEVIAELKPDVILVQQFTENPEAEYRELLESPVLADVPAVKDHRVSYLPVSTSGETAGVAITEGLEQVGKAIGTL